MIKNQNAMRDKLFKGKAIYNPKGKAGEYSEWACNFFNGCSNNCDYCYCKRGVRSHVWSDKPQLKKCFKDEADALLRFEKELMANIPELREKGIFFTFTSDPFLKETANLTWGAIHIALTHEVPVQALTKRVEFACSHLCLLPDKFRKMVAVGFTLTGHDEMEPGASTNLDRIKAMKELHLRGFKTFASIEPVVDFDSSLDMIKKTVGFCDLYKVGLMSGRTKMYDLQHAIDFVHEVHCVLEGNNAKVYWKESIRNMVDVEELAKLTDPDLIVSHDYNIFEEEL